MDLPRLLETIYGGRGPTVPGEFEFDISSIGRAQEENANTFVVLEDCDIPGLPVDSEGVIARRQALRACVKGERNVRANPGGEVLSKSCGVQRQRKQCQHRQTAEVPVHIYSSAHRWFRITAF